MLQRSDPDGLVLITQPAHAWLAGEIARAWGGAGFGRFEPHAETVLAAGQHDCGWLDWELQPTLRTETGLPHSFLDLPPAEHRRIWTRGPRLAAIENPFAGLLVSLHGTGLYARYRSGTPDPETQAYLEAETAWQAGMVQALRTHGRYAPHVSPDALERNRRLVAGWDEMSLFLCLATSGTRTIRNVPAADAGVDLTMTLTPEGVVLVDPWPFLGPRQTFGVAARRLRGTFDNVEPMREALAVAPGIDLEFNLRPSPG